VTDWRNLRGKTVIVHALDITYRGTVVEMGETSLLLKAEGGFREISWAQITGLEELDSTPTSDPTGGGHGCPYG
jgi:hypothetical protein